MAAFDYHGDMHDPPTVAAFRAFVDEYRPPVRIMGGDLFDFRWLRRSASDDEKLEAVEADFEHGMEFLRWFKPTVFLWGNHDQRLRDALDSNAGQGAMKALARQWIEAIEDATPGCQHFPYDKRRGVFRYGDHAFLHGYSHGIGAIRKAALTYGNVIMGHVHRRDRVTVEGVPRRIGHSSGCLCRLDMDYNRANIGTLAQDNGWVYGTNIDGRLLVLHAERMDEGWYAPMDLERIKC